MQSHFWNVNYFLDYLFYGYVFDLFDFNGNPNDLFYRTINYSINESVDRNRIWLFVGE
jgi:hypothetical protein